MKKETKKIIYWGLGILILIGVLILMPSGGDKANKSTEVSVSSASTLSVVENDFDFGSIMMQDGEVSHNFEVKNEGTEPVQIGRVYTSCACTTAYIIDSSGQEVGKFGMLGHKGLRTSADVEIAPGESVMVKAVYDPEFHGPSGVGLADRSIYIESNSSKSPKLELSFRAMVTR